MLRTVGDYFTCVTTPDRSYVRVAPFVTCWEGEHLTYMPLLLTAAVVCKFIACTRCTRVIALSDVRVLVLLQTSSAFHWPLVSSC